MLQLCDPPPGPVHVTLRRPRQNRPGVIFHRAEIPVAELTVVRGIPTTTVPRTLLDLSGMVNPARLRRLVKQAEFKGLVTIESLTEALARHPRRSGRRALADLVDGYLLSSGRTRSEMEDEFIAFCADRGIPLAETNAAFHVGGRTIEVDCLWRDARLVVELDGRKAHATPTAFEEDRARPAADRGRVAADARHLAAPAHRSRSARAGGLRRASVALADARRIGTPIGA